MLAAITGAAVNLNCFVRAPDCGFGCVVLGDRGFECARLAGILDRPGLVDQQPRSFGLDDHVSDHRLDELEAGDRTIELCSFVGVSDRFFERGAGKADAAGGNRVTAGVERAHRDLEAVTNFAEHRIGRGGHVVKRDLSRV